ncbi:ferrous iron transporter B [Undibacterium sp. RTI2.1]|uniref:ferrous iron transporter B n=1 Tax=unclassified Undibacterium TaxID=2630295 RepID=UPI002AB4A269|nr:MULTISPECIES: ferrous iron transporter B [unclassified Undibacterium]MDY7537910.1 ferrous iron transporter B [Undibacterium sp. 5I1]MEB0032586.1 ferrous iron transporter B [Undibacterium sp. RTI2.1]MEB0118645.1 ferrous iron transporter B [Undibacterium sp. RTI2.2]MEB0232490.1 ferrous iron transporter B [Undibacterium sp. 10I3]MEB0259566.1 ferrous iron transporter B [Undibacterium sp. 5I1]
MSHAEFVVELLAPRIALVGNPNCGKTALFNRLTGARQKVANYAGVTIERKEGKFRSPTGRTWHVLDLPGTYSLHAITPDEKITQDVITGQRADEAIPDAVVCVVDATNLKRGLRVALELKNLGIPMILAVNMMDVARKRDIHIDIALLQTSLGIPVVETVAVTPDGIDLLLGKLEILAGTLKQSEVTSPTKSITALTPESIQTEANAILARCVSYDVSKDHHFSFKLDSFVLHPLIGPVIFAILMFLVFQAVFAWAQLPMDLIKSSVDATGAFVESHMQVGMLQGLLVKGVIGGAGSVLVFLPQIVILFFFILVMEDSGYLPRAAFLLDRVMGKVGLSGRAFIPLLSSFACAIPGIMATRTIQNPRDRLVTIMIAPLMTCSARLPVYTLIIAAFIPAKMLGGWLNLQGLVLFLLYLAGIVSAMLVAFVLKKKWGSSEQQPLMLELPDYRLPNSRNLMIGLWERIKIFVTRVGTIILALMILLWFLSSFPGAPENATQPPIYYSIAGILGRMLEVIFAPIGFNWQICIALVPGLAAREVAVAALGTVYALSQSGDDLSNSLQPLIAHSWSVPTALSLLAWYVFAPQCIATLSVVKRETNTWRYPLLMAAYLFGLAYFASFVTYNVAKLLMGA